MESLVDRLRDPEDRFVERKPPNAGKSDFKRTIVAFANSTPPNRVGVLFVGVADDGTAIGVDNPDRTQKDLRQLAENDCYPPIYIDTEVVRVGDKQIVAALVKASTQRPHFAGPAYVRRGSESVNATEREYEELIASRVSTARQLLSWVGQTVTVTEVKTQLGEYFDVPGDHHQSDEYRIVEVTAHYVRFLQMRSGVSVTEILDALRVSWDDKKHRPRVIAFPYRAAGA